MAQSGPEWGCRGVVKFVLTSLKDLGPCRPVRGAKIWAAGSGRGREDVKP